MYGLDEKNKMVTHIGSLMVIYGTSVLILLMSSYIISFVTKNFI